MVPRPVPGVLLLISLRYTLRAPHLPPAVLVSQWVFTHFQPCVWRSAPDGGIHFFNACRICGASSGGAHDGGHRDSTCRVSGACISWARSAGTNGGARRASSSQVRSIAACIVPVPVVSAAPVQAVRTAPAPVAEASRCRNQRCCGVAPLSTAVASCRVFAAFG